MFLLPNNKAINLFLYQIRDKKVRVKFILSNLQLEFNGSICVKSTKIVSLPWFYIISCNPSNLDNRTDSNDCFILTFFYPPNSSTRYFERSELKFSIDHDSAQEAEFSNSADICQLINQYRIGTQIDSDKPYLLIINPQSGTRKGQRIYNDCVSELFNICNVKYELLMTDKPLHARSFIKCCESLKKYRGIVTVSGDGLVFEVFCGIMDRDSWLEDIGSTPVGVIPAGSGNGLAASISAFSGINPNEKIILYHTLLLTRPTVNCLDLMRVQTSAVNQFPSFLSLTWGLMAHVDVGSDNLRWMGPARFSAVAAVQLAKMIKYKGKLWYLPAHSDNIDGNCATQVINNNASFYNGERMKNISFGNSSFRYLPDISQPMPDNGKWVLLDQMFISVIASLLPYLAINCKIAPAAQINDGKIYIIIINPEISRSELLNCITKLETGGHFSCKSISYIECLAFRLVPECDKCYMAIDGEYLPNTPIQCEIMASVARTFTGPPVNEPAVLN